MDLFEIKSSDYKVLDYIHLKSTGESPWCYASKPTMAADLRISVPTVNRSISVLLEKGLIKKGKKPSDLKTTNKFRKAYSIYREHGSKGLLEGPYQNDTDRIKMIRKPYQNDTEAYQNDTADHIKMIRNTKSNTKKKEVVVEKEEKTTSTTTPISNGNSQSIEGLSSKGLHSLEAEAGEPMTLAERVLQGSQTTIPKLIESIYMQEDLKERIVAMCSVHQPLIREYYAAFVGILIDARRKQGKTLTMNEQGFCELLAEDSQDKHFKYAYKYAKYESTTRRLEEAKELEMVMKLQPNVFILDDRMAYRLDIDSIMVKTPNGKTSLKIRPYIFDGRIKGVSYFNPAKKEGNKWERIPSSRIKLTKVSPEELSRIKDNGFLIKNAQ